MLKQILALLRPDHYIKNIFIFLPLFFGLKGLHSHLLIELIIAFVGFSMIASSVYILNDILDIERDRAHPIKKNRPLAAGTVSLTLAKLLGLVLCAIGLWVAHMQSVGLLVLGYLGLNILYSVKLKHMAIIDVFIIAVGFVIRLMIGAVVSGIECSMWIIIMTFLLALFLALSKRKGGLYNSGVNSQARPVLDQYNQEFLSICMGIMGSVVIVSYIMYTTSEAVIERTGSQYVYATSFFVLFGILRYLKITLLDQDSGSPTKVLIQDIGLQLCIVAWGLSFAFLLYR